MDFLATARRQMLAGQVHDARERLLASFSGLSDEELQIPGVCGDWSVRDILAHLAAWDRATTELYRAMLVGERDPFLDLDEDGVERFDAEQHAGTLHIPLADVIAELHASREDMLTLLRDVDNAKLFAPAPGDEHADYSIAACINVTINHDEEHAEMIEEWRSSR